MQIGAESQQKQILQLQLHQNRLHPQQQTHFRYQLQKKETE
jgi:hypothetical protein